MGLSQLRLGAAALFALAVIPHIAFAQATPPTPSRQELNRAERAPPRLSAPPPDLFSNPGAGACPLAENPAPLTITSVRLNGLTAATPEALQPAYADLLNKPGDASDLCKVRDRVSDALFDRGILARVEIPAQNIEGGAVTIEVIEAHIVNVVVRGDAGPTATVLEAYAAKLRGMAPFDINKVQRYILLASDLPGTKVQASVRPSPSGERGAVDLDLNVLHDPHDLIVNTQNLQSTATGRWGVLARADFDGFTSLGERTSIVGYRTFQSEQWVIQGLQEARIGGEGLVVRASLAYGESTPGAALKPLGLKSKSVVASFEAAYPLLRKRRENVWLAGGIEMINQDTTVGGGGGLLINDDLRVLYARMDVDRTYYWGPRPVLLTGQFGVRQGLDGLGATPAGDRFLSRAAARPGATVAFAEGSAFAVLTPRLSVLARVEGQYSARPLAAYEEYAVGSLTIGRGYDPAFISGDSAIAASLEVRGGPYQPVSGWTVSPYAFFDIARVSDQDPGGLTQSVSSVGIGFQAPLRERWLLDVAYAYPLERRELDRARPSPRLLVNLTARFF